MSTARCTPSCRSFSRRRPKGRCARDAGVAEDAGAVEFGFGGALRSSALTAPGPSTEKFSTLLELFREAFREATREDDFRLPRKYLESFARSCPMTRI
jgi:hypothetical protein